MEYKCFEIVLYFSYVYKNYSGETIKEIGYQIGGCSVSIGKTVAIRETILSTIQMEHTRIIIESGLQVTINAINRQNAFSWQIRKLVQDIQNIAKHLENIVFHYCNKKANRMIDCVTKVSSLYYINFMSLIKFLLKFQEKKKGRVILSSE